MFATAKTIRTSLVILMLENALIRFL